jgi:signal transduction histidine kinase
LTQAAEEATLRRVLWNQDYRVLQKLAKLDADIAAIAGMESMPTILDVICRTTGMGFAAVARVTEDRWIACGVRDDIAFGLKPGGELPVRTTICNDIRRSGQAVAIDHVAEDAAFRSHPVPALYGFQSYISMPIVLASGRFFGTLCAIDPRPARVNTAETIGMFKMFAGLIAAHLDAAERVTTSEATLLDERQASALREQFIAVLGHDLRNPLAAIDAGMHLLLRTPLNDKATRTVGMIQSSVGRMARLIDDVLDLARVRLGGGFGLERDAGEPLEPVLTQVIAESRAAFPERAIEASFALTDPIDCDNGRIGQLFSNLLGNAVRHGSPDRPIRVEAATRQGVFELSVANSGPPIQADALARLFEPFFRGPPVQAGQQGLGLGLYIAAEIARAHGGTLDVISTEQETRFTLRMPTG